MIIKETLVSAKPSVLHLNQIGYGGAWNAAVNIDESVKQLGIKSSLEYEYNLDQKKRLLTRLGAKLDFEIQSFTDDNGTVSAFRGIGSNPWLKSLEEKYMDFGIWNLHWLPGYPNTLIRRILSNRNVVWTLHDVHAFTGVCHTLRMCNNFQVGCVSCPQYPQPLHVIPKEILKRKRSVTKSAKKLKFVAPSNWILNEFKKSLLADYAEIVRIPNPVPQHFFLKSRSEKPQTLTITILGKNYSQTKNSFLAAESIMRFKELYPDIPVKLQVIGEPFKIFNMSEQVCLNLDSDSKKVAEFLKKSHVFVYTSRNDNLPNLVMEAQATGNVIVALNYGGIAECFTPEKSGLVSEDNLQALTNSIWKVASNRELLLKMSEFATRFAEENFSTTLIGNQYKKLYEGIQHDVRANQA